MNENTVPTVALIGPGKWGSRMIRALSTMARIKHVGHRGNEASRRILTDAGMESILTTDLNRIWNDPEVGHVFITTPLLSHVPLAMQALNHGKHVFVEKPLSCNREEVALAHATARHRQLKLMTGYIYLHDRSLQHLKARIAHEPCCSLDLTWNKWGSFDSDLISNLLVHELAIAHFLLGPLDSIHEIEIHDDLLQLKASAKDTAITISIDRKHNTKRKRLHCITARQSYQLQDGVLSSEGLEIHRDPTLDWLARECRAFLDDSWVCDGLDLDLGVADALRLLQNTKPRSGPPPLLLP